MKTLEAKAKQQGEIPLSKWGSGAFAEGVCKAQNLAEQGRFEEAAAVLGSLETEDAGSDWRRMLKTRVEILQKWAATDHVELDDYRTFYLDVGPEWFRKRIAPIVRAWQEDDFSPAEKHFLIAELLKKRGDTKGYILALSAIPALPQVEEEHATRALLAAGNACHESGDKHNAERFWTEATKHPAPKSAWAKAVFNLGILAKEREEFPKAIEHFSAVLASTPNDKEAGAHIMEAYRNYSHRSALEISRCYEGTGDYHDALRYAWLAKRRYPHLSWCGTCRMSSNWAMNKRIGYLAFRAYGVWGIVVVLTIVGARLYCRRKKKSEPPTPADAEKTGAAES